MRILNSRAISNGCYDHVIVNIAITYTLQLQPHGYYSLIIITVLWPYLVVIKNQGALKSDRTFSRRIVKLETPIDTIPKNRYHYRLISRLR